MPESFLLCPSPNTSSDMKLNPSWCRGSILFLFWRLENYFSMLTLYLSFSCPHLSCFWPLVAQTLSNPATNILTLHVLENCYQENFYWDKSKGFYGNLRNKLHKYKIGTAWVNGPRILAPMYRRGSWGWKPWMSLKLTVLVTGGTEARAQIILREFLSSFQLSIMPHSTLLQSFWISNLTQ